MSDKVTVLRQFHETQSFGSRENRQWQEQTAADFYRRLSQDEAGELARFALDSLNLSTHGVFDPILLNLACLRPGSLSDFHPALIEHGVFYPAVIYYGASPETSAGDGIYHMFACPECGVAATGYQQS